MLWSRRSTPAAVTFTWDEGHVAIEVEEVETGRASSSPRPAARLEHGLLAPRDRPRLRLSDVFDALGDPTRRHIVESLGRQEASATQLASELPVTRQAVAKHLTALREAGLVDSRKQGRETLYRLNTEPLDAAAAWIVRVGGEWDARLARLRGTRSVAPWLRPASAPSRSRPCTPRRMRRRSR